jgi:hypothetical protein
MGQEMFFCLPNIFEEILLHILGYSFSAERHILACFCQTVLPLEASKIIRTKAVLLWHQKCW